MKPTSIVVKSQNHKVMILPWYIENYKKILEKAHLDLALLEQKRGKEWKKKDVQYSFLAKICFWLMIMQT